MAERSPLFISRFCCATNAKPLSNVFCGVIRARCHKVWALNTTKESDMTWNLQRRPLVWLMIASFKKGNCDMTWKLQWLPLILLIWLSDSKQFHIDHLTAAPASLAVVLFPALTCSANWRSWLVIPPKRSNWIKLLKCQKFRNPHLFTFAGFCELLRVFCVLLRVFCVRFFLRFWMT